MTIRHQRFNLLKRSLFSYFFLSSSDLFILLQFNLDNTFIEHVLSSLVTRSYLEFYYFSRYVETFQVLRII